MRRSITFNGPHVAAMLCRPSTAFSSCRPTQPSSRRSASEWPPGIGRFVVNYSWMFPDLMATFGAVAFAMLTSSLL
jgi:hypothetical protein